MNKEPAAKLFKPTDLLAKIEDSRKSTAESVANFLFNKKRVRLLKMSNDIPDKNKGILYWMLRDIRVQDNWAFLFAQRAAIKRSVPLHVCFCVTSNFSTTFIRQRKFLLRGLQQIEEECNNLNICFHLLRGEPNLIIPSFVIQYQMGAVITDFTPLRLPLYWLEELKKNLPTDVPLCQVDAHNIVPCWIASDKLEHSARTIRGKINSKLDEFLTEFPPIIKHEYSTDQAFDNTEAFKSLGCGQEDKSVGEIEWAKPGYRYGILELESFLNDRLMMYHTKRNDPVYNATSNLSAWFHFGMISVQRCIIELAAYKKTCTESVKSFMEEAIVRRELSDNFCFYNEHYDNIKGAKGWAIETLDNHRADKREYTYNLDELENSLTHDSLWNASQNQLVQQGKMHGFLRMYWAKKILEWTATPDNALEWAILLNDKYSIDGSDPNGYVGCMWSVCGVHDQGWKERKIFGKIRYMNYQGCKRKFNVDEFVAKWKGKEHGPRGKRN